MEAAVRVLAQPMDQFGSSWGAIIPPTITQPADGSTGLSVALALLMGTTPFLVVQGSDTHAFTDWEIRDAPDGGGNVVWSSYGDATNLLTKLLPILTLSFGRDYYIRARHNGATLGAGVWSADAHIRT